jgi:hypothetical protein
MPAKIYTEALAAAYERGRQDGLREAVALLQFQSCSCGHQITRRITEIEKET